TARMYYFLRTIPMSQRGSRQTLAFALALGIVVVWAFEGRASAEELESAELTYSSRAPECPDDESFRQQVAARLGYQPFRGGGKPTGAGTPSLDPGRVRGRGGVRRAGAAHAGVRELVGEPGRCDALVTALAAAVAIAIDPPRFSRTAPSAPPPPAEEPPPQQ